MGLIHLKNIRTFSHHGCLSEETKIGSDYLVNLSVRADLSGAAKSDALEDTVDYVRLNHIVKREMAVPSKLLEHVAQRIVDSVFAELELVSWIEISVAKVNPPIGGDVAQVVVTLSDSR